MIRPLFATIPLQPRDTGHENTIWAEKNMPLSNREYAKKRILEEKEDRDRAKQVILQILRRAGGSLGKTKLFKAFWLAHLFYAKNSTGYLSSWKIVRLPHGPGIDNGDELIFQLKKSGSLVLEHQPQGPYTETVCKVIVEGGQSLTDAANEAIDSAVRVIKLHDSAAQISEWSHEISRSWSNTPNGDELDIYSDLIPDDVYYERKIRAEEMNDVYDDLFK
jgi:hypothetical protein